MKSNDGNKQEEKYVNQMKWIKCAFGFWFVCWNMLSCKCRKKKKKKEKCCWPVRLAFFLYPNCTTSKFHCTFHNSNSCFQTSIKYTVVNYEQNSRFRRCKSIQFDFSEKSFSFVFIRLIFFKITRSAFFWLQSPPSGKMNSFGKNSTTKIFYAHMHFR